MKFVDALGNEVFIFDEQCWDSKERRDILNGDTPCELADVSCSKCAYKGVWECGELAFEVDLMKCKTCNGYGLWAIGNPAPMGRMDATDGLPTKPCPECGSDANPKRRK